LNEMQLDVLNNYINKRIWLGIRPEDIHDGEDQSLTTNCTTFTTKLDVVEPMGNEAFLYFNIDNIQFISRISTRVVPDDGSVNTLKIDNQKLHFFDYESGITIL